MTPSPAATRSATTATTSADARAFAELDVHVRPAVIGPGRDATSPYTIVEPGPAANPRPGPRPGYPASAGFVARIEKKSGS